ncbi:MAG: hypothetical protein ABWY10_02400 [Tardiphaga sp.]
MRERTKRNDSRIVIHASGIADMLSYESSHDLQTTIDSDNALHRHESGRRKDHAGHDMSGMKSKWEGGVRASLF